MQIRPFLFYLFIVFTFLEASAQSNDFGIWTSLGAEKKFGKLELSTEAELRTMNNSSDINRFSLQITPSYKIIKQIKVGAGYQFIYFNDVKYSDFQPRHRFILFTQGEQKWGRFNFSLRERLQLTTKDESDRIKSSGEIDTYKTNPEWSWRNRLKVEFDPRHSRISPYFSIETFYQLNNPDGNVFDNLRYTLGAQYKLSKSSKIEVYGLLNNEINVSNPVRGYVVGAGYNFSF